MLIGWPAFLAPEQWDGVPLSPATDQYSLAAVIYLVTAGSTPYEGQEHPDVRRRNFTWGAPPAHEMALRNGLQGAPV